MGPKKRAGLNFGGGDFLKEEIFFPFQKDKRISRCDGNNLYR